VFIAAALLFLPTILSTTGVTSSGTGARRLDGAGIGDPYSGQSRRWV